VSQFKEFAVPLVLCVLVVGYGNGSKGYMPLLVTSMSDKFGDFSFMMIPEVPTPQAPMK